MLIRIAEPHPLLVESTAAATRARGDEPMLDLHEIDSSSYVHDEAGLLDESELTDARAALVEDGIFAPREWAESELRIAVKYGWALAHAAQSTQPGLNLWSVAEGCVATTPDELRFLTAEIRARAIAITHISPCWPVSIEPAIEFGERAEAFQRALGDYALALRGSGLGLFLPHAAGKAIDGAPADALLDFTNAGWLEAARALTRADAPLFRRVLTCAQEHFALDKPRTALATSEDEIRTLPDVPDSELERTFLDDPRGRQLLHVTARSIFADASLRGPLVAFLSSLP